VSDITLSEAQESVSKLFNAFGITKVVYVDDYFDVDFDKINAAKNKDDIIQEFFPEIIISNQEIQDDRLRKKCEDLEDSRKVEIAKKLIPDSDIGIDQTIIPDILQVMSDYISPISPSHWNKAKERFLCNWENSLFLFDQDLKLYPEISNAMDGMVIITEITSKNPEIVCGLITQTIKQEECVAKRDELREKFGISNSDKFFIIPKSDLDSNKALFVYFLKLAVLSKYFIDFKGKVQDALNEAAKKAKNQIDQIHVDDFNHIFFETPKNEGAWEPDMFFRIHSNFYRKEYAKSFFFSDTVFLERLQKIRLISDIPTKPVEHLIPSSAWKIQHDELYEEGDYLNKNHLPIELGDIFEMIDSNRSTTRKFILLMQPCDLIIRSNGSRSHARDDKRIALFEIKSNKVKQYKSDFEDELTYFGESSEEQYYIKYKEAYLIKDYILDLCVYSSEGVSEYKSDYTCDEHIRPTLKERYEKIQKAIKKTLQRYEEIKSEIKKRNDSNNERLLEKIIYPFFTDDLFCGEYKEKDGVFTITFNCKRTSRFKFDRAAGLLTRYYSVLQRPAFDVDYGQL